MPQHEQINYVEFPAKNLDATKEFFKEVFSFSFEDFGPDYTAFSNAGLNGGFYRSKLNASVAKGSALVVFYSENLESTMEKIKRSNGVITQDIFTFPGGRRFHFCDPSDNEFAVWSDKKLLPTI